MAHWVSCHQWSFHSNLCLKKFVNSRLVGMKFYPKISQHIVKNLLKAWSKPLVMLSLVAFWMKYKTVHTSKVAYCANFYTRVTSSNAKVSSMLASKTRVAPLKGETIPLLILMAALTLANLWKLCLRHWAVLYVWWRFNGESKQLKQFVQNQKDTIRRLWSKEHSRYCTSELNRVTLLREKLSPLIFHLVICGGRQHLFLKKEVDEWPNHPNCQITEDIVLEGTTEELSKRGVENISCVMATSVPVSQNK